MVHLLGIGFGIQVVHRGDTGTVTETQVARRLGVGCPWDSLGTSARYGDWDTGGTLTRYGL